jgi:hypothetical protein
MCPLSMPMPTSAEVMLWDLKMMKIFFTIGAILLIGIVLFGFQKINAKQPKQKEKSSHMKTETKNLKTAT